MPAIRWAGALVTTLSASIFQPPACGCAAILERPVIETILTHLG
jgi:hypothetical protein